jgi:hypothetical protein
MRGRSSGTFCLGATRDGAVAHFGTKELLGSGARSPNPKELPVPKDRAPNTLLCSGVPEPNENPDPKDGDPHDLMCSYT